MINLRWFLNFTKAPQQSAEERMIDMKNMFFTYFKHPATNWTPS